MHNPPAWHGLLFPVLCPDCHTCLYICEQSNPVPDTREIPDGDPTLRYANGDPVSDNPPEIQALETHIKAEGKISLDVNKLGKWVWQTSGLTAASSRTVEGQVIGSSGSLVLFFCNLSLMRSVRCA